MENDAFFHKWLKFYTSVALYYDLVLMFLAPTFGLLNDTVNVI